MTCVDYRAGVDTACASHLRVVSIHFHSEFHSGRLIITFVILASTNRSRASLACHETGSLVVQVTSFLLDIYVTLTFSSNPFSTRSRTWKWMRKTGLWMSCLTKDQPSLRTLHKESYCAQHSTYLPFSPRRLSLFFPLPGIHA
jgi:hypothetical protein